MPVRANFRYLLIVCLFIVLPARAADLAIVLSDRTPAFGEFAEQLRLSLQGSAWRVKSVLVADNLGESAARDVDAWVVVGAEALRQALLQTQAPPILAALLTRHSYERHLAVATRPRNGIAAVVLDQPVGRQLALLQQLFPERRRLGLLTSADSRAFAARIKAAGSWQLEIEDASDDAAVVAAATRLLARSEVLLAQPDPLIYHRNNIRPILLASYRFRRPVVGFSTAFVGAGAIAALYSTPQQIAGQVAELLSAGGKKLPQGVIYPDRFSLAYNRQVAQSLGIDLPEENAVLRALENRRFEP